MSANGPARSTAGEWFAHRVNEYDSLIRRAVPGYESMTRRLADYLPANARRILELGCGTGNFSLALATRYPTADLTVVDAAQEMIDVTRGRIASVHPAFEGRVRFITGRFEELALEPEAFDVVASCISLHHVRDKAPLFNTIHHALEAGGRFCFADQMRAAPESINQRHWEDWLSFCREPGNCTDAEIEQLLEHAAEFDHYETAGQHLRILNDAGFTEVDCLWRSGMWTIMAATA